MNNKKELPKIIKEISLQEIQRIDAALEGNWSPTVVTVWSREKGIHGFSEVSLTHPEHKPSLELYFKNTWIGIHCFRRTDNRNVFDEDYALKIIEYVENSGIRKAGLLKGKIRMAEDFDEPLEDMKEYME